MSPVAYTTATAPAKRPTSMRDPVAEKADFNKAAALEDLTRRVRDQSDRLQRALSPLADRIKMFAEERPVIFTGLSIFFALSIVPILCTILFIVFLSTLFTGIAIFLLFLSVGGAIALSMTFLVPVLIVCATLAGMAVGVLLALFLVHRLYLHIRSASEHMPGLSGILSGMQSWLDETLGRIGVGSNIYGPAFDGRSIDYHYPSTKSQPPSRSVSAARYASSSAAAAQAQALAQLQGHRPSKIKTEPHDIQDVFSPEPSTPNELRHAHENQWVDE